MEPEALPAREWTRLAAIVADTCGLHFPVERYRDLARALEAAARERGQRDGADIARELLNEPTREAVLRALIPHLTIGETYFFRETPGFDALATEVLPRLIERRRATTRTLRLWSAACSTGEEAYSLAILVSQLIPDIENWRVSILGTDINPEALRKAEAGIYGSWSFRGAKRGLRRNYFIAEDENRYRVMDRIRSMVTFRGLNLAANEFASPFSGLRDMDLILCRNLLIYFTPEHARRLVRGLRDCIVEDGWLLVGPSECSQELFRDFEPVNLPNAIFYRHRTATPLPVPAPPAQWIDVPEPAPSRPPPAAVPARSTAEEEMENVRALIAAGRIAEAIEKLRAALERPALRHDTRLLRQLTQLLANQGDRAAALEVSERWIAVDRLDAAAHYFHALVLLELGQRARARDSFKRAIYLLPDFALAHVSLGTVARAERRHDEARRHLESAARLLASRPAADEVDGAEGMSVGRLREMVSALLEGRA